MNTPTFPTIKAVSTVAYGFLKLNFSDGYESIVDIRPLIETGEYFDSLRNDGIFNKVQKDEFGHRVFWLDSEGNEIDLGADGLRATSERQTAMHKLMAY